MKIRSAILGLCALLTGLGTLASCAPKQDAAKAEAPATIRVAFVYIGPPGDGGYTFQHDQGRKFLEAQLGIKCDTVENVPEGADAERVITDLAQNHDVVFTTSFGYMDPTLNVAKKFPKVKFVKTRERHDVNAES